jgi:hypothetical protein
LTGEGRRFVADPAVALTTETLLGELLGGGCVSSVGIRNPVSKSTVGGFLVGVFSTVSTKGANPPLRIRILRSLNVEFIVVFRRVSAVGGMSSFLIWVSRRTAQ